jgi:hypothetical protein
MAKFSPGDIAIVTDRRGPMVVEIIANRHSRVAPYQVKILEAPGSCYKVGEISYFSGRDMEHKEMQGKKKIYCCVPGCTTYSFESKGTIQWQCDKHCPTAFTESDTVSLEEKVDLILEHLGLEITTEPKKVVLAERKADG